MLDIRCVRQELQLVRDMLRERGMDVSPDHLPQMDEERRALLQTAEKKKTDRNMMYAQLAAAKKQDKPTEALTDGLSVLNAEIKALDERIAALETELEASLRILPNLPRSDVPMKRTELAHMGESSRFDWEPKTYRELGQDLGIAAFWPAKGRSAEAMRCHAAGRQLKRAVTNLLLDGLHEAGYTEAEQLCGEATAVCAVPNAEASVLNAFRGRIFDADELPISVCAHAVCPKEDGFFADRVDLCRVTCLDETDDALEQMTADLEKLFDRLALVCRTVLRGRDELDFSAAKTTDIEVWLPCEQRYVPAASCSDCADFTARDLELRFRARSKEKPHTARTLYAVIDLTRVTAAILGNNQQGDGSVRLPDKLAAYMQENVIR